MKVAVMSTPLLQQKIASLAGKRVQVEEAEGLLPQKDDKRYHLMRCQRKIAIEKSLQEVSEKIVDDFTILQRVAVDLGAECTHPQMRRWHKYRFWGLCICAAPCIHGLHGISHDDSWYDQTATRKVKELAKAHPSLRDEFIDRVLKNHDYY